MTATSATDVRSAARRLTEAVDRLGRVLDVLGDGAGGRPAEIVTEVGAVARVVAEMHDGLQAAADASLTSTRDPDADLVRQGVALATAAIALAPGARALRDAASLLAPAGHATAPPGALPLMLTIAYQQSAAALAALTSPEASRPGSTR